MTRAAAAAPRSLGPRIVIVPVFNEQDTLREVLEQVERAGFERIIAVDDGSTDGSGAVLDAWVAGRETCDVIHLGQNRGKSAALRAARQLLRLEFERGRLSGDALVINVDADGQHDLAYLGPLIDRMAAEDADAMIARRDFSYHGRYKRLGNIVMTALGSLFAGRRMHDIESGFRVIRLDALLHAQEFYTGRRYSECVEQAVVLHRLGYRVDNEFLVHVPVGRTRTRLSDAANHVVRGAAAAYRVACWRDMPCAQRSWLGMALATVVLVAFGGFMLTVLSHPFYLGNDSAQSYGHVWFIEHSLRTTHAIPWRIPNLDSGRAWTFPYAAIPWIPAALLRPLFGDWIVTASMGVGVALFLAGTAKWLPRTSSPIVMGIVLLNWQWWNAVLQFQLPTIWALAFAMLSAAAFDRGRFAVGAAGAALALIAHPLMGGVGLGVTVLAHVEQSRRLPFRRAAWLLLAVLLAWPAVWTFLHVPSIEHVGRWGWKTPLHILLQRSSLILWPWLCHRAIVITGRIHVGVLLVGVALLGRNVMGSNPQNATWNSLPRFRDFIADGLVDPDARYRVLTMSNQEDGMVQLVQAGATLTQSFFDESVDRRSFWNTEDYRCFLTRKGADRIVVQDEWIRRGTSNEVKMLDGMVREGTATLAYQGWRGTREYRVTAPPPDRCARRSDAGAR